MDDKNKRGHPQREWTDDIVEWCGENLQQLSQLALDRSNWQQVGEAGIGRQRTLNP